MFNVNFVKFITCFSLLEHPGQQPAYGNATKPAGKASGNDVYKISLRQNKVDTLHQNNQETFPNDINHKQSMFYISKIASLYIGSCDFPHELFV